MTTINLSIDFTDTQITGIAQARTAFNVGKDVSLTDTEYLEFVLVSAADSYALQYSGAEPVEPSPVDPVADWAALQNHILGGDLFDIYTRLTTACFVAPNSTLPQISNANNIAVASGKLDQAVAVTKVEGAVFASFQLLVTTSDYRFTAEEKALWDSTVDSLNFSELVHLP